MCINPNYSQLFTGVEEKTKEFKKIYLLEKNRETIRKYGVSDEFNLSLNYLIDSLINLGETFPEEVLDENLEELRIFSDSPIFIGGVHKSGTTLLRNLLDGHRELVVLPLDGPGIHFFKKAVKGGKEKCHREILQQILKRIMIPSPEGWYDTGDWLLSAGEVNIEPYITFARTYYSCISIFGGDIKGIFQSMAIAFRLSTCQQDEAKATSWVHKCTLHVESACELSVLFPKAKFLHIARHPCGIYASQKTKSPAIKQRDCNPNYELECLQRGFSYGINNYSVIGSDRYYILKYEDLVENVRDCMKQIISYLEYDYDDTLVTPSIIGVAVKSNTAYSENKNKAGRVNDTSIEIWNKKLTKDEVNVLIYQLWHELPFYGYLEKKISIKNFFWSLVRVELKYFGEKGVKLFNFNSIIHMILSVFLKKKPRIQI